MALYAQGARCRMRGPVHPSPRSHWPTWPVAGLAWLLGLALQLQQPQLWPGTAYVGCALAAMLTLLALQGLQPHMHAAWPWVLRSATRLAWAALGWAALGWATAGLQASAQPPAIDPQLEGRDIDVVGRVSAMGQVHERG